MSVGVTKDYKLKVRNLHVSYVWDWVGLGTIVVYYETMNRKLI
jgi:hypothetical protein